MPFIIPNAIDTTGSNRYNALDQAEPDALDFEILGERKSGVLTGCEVTAQTVANYTVSVSGGYVVLNGTVYEIGSNPAFSLPTVPSNNRFDVIVARLTNGAMSLVAITGPDSASNPSFPPTPNRMTTVVGVSLTTYINPSTDVVLAAVYRAGAANITKAHIVDKRSNLAPTSLRGDAVPSDTFGSDGDLYYKTATLGDPGIYVKLNGAWAQIGTGGPAVDMGVPVGTVITWPVSNTSPSSAGWLECNGQSVNRTTYADLFAAIGTTYGADDSLTFKVPDFRGYVLMGLSGGRSVATPYGNTDNKITLSVTQLPQHTHGFSGVQTTSSGSHSHQAGGNFGIMLRSSASSTSTGSLRVHAPYGSTSGTNLGVGRTDTAGAHQHTLAGTTDATGSGSVVDVEPRNYQVRYFIKHA